MTTTPTSRRATLPAQGTAAATIYVGAAVAQYLFRDGLEVDRHILSLAENGEHGWIQIASFLLTGALTIAAAIGMRRAMTGRPGARWAPRLVGLYGAGLIGAGIFPADPAAGFPPGTPEGVAEFTGQGIAHFTLAGLGFLGVIAAAFVMARAFLRAHQRGMATYSIATGVALLAAWAGLSTAPGPVTTVAFVTAALHASVWVAVITGAPKSRIGSWTR